MRCPRRRLDEFGPESQVLGNFDRIGPNSALKCCPARVKCGRCARPNSADLGTRLAKVGLISATLGPSRLNRGRIRSEFGRRPTTSQSLLDSSRPFWFRTPLTPSQLCETPVRGESDKAAFGRTSERTHWPCEASLLVMKSLRESEMFAISGYEGFFRNRCCFPGRGGLGVPSRHPSRRAVSARTLFVHSRVLRLDTSQRCLLAGSSKFPKMCPSCFLSRTPGFWLLASSGPMRSRFRGRRLSLRERAVRELRARVP